MGIGPVRAGFGAKSEWEGVGDTYGGALDSGLDNSPMYDDVPFDTERHTIMLADVGLTSLYVMDCTFLAEIAELLAKSAEAAELRERGFGLIPLIEAGFVEGAETPLSAGSAASRQTGKSSG